MDPFGNPYDYRPVGNRPPSHRPAFPNMTYVPPNHPAPASHPRPPSYAAAASPLKENLQKTCGKLVEWKRVRDPSGQPKAFGFAIYEHPASILRSIRLLGGEDGNQGVKLTAKDGSNVEKKLIVKADDKVRQYLDQYRGSQESDAQTAEMDEDATALQQIERLTKESAPSFIDTLDRDLSYFQEQRTRDSDDQSSGHRRDHGHRRGRDHRRERHRDSSSPSRHHVHEFDVKMQEQDEKTERSRQDRRRKDDEAHYRQKERRFEQREKERLDMYKHAEEEEAKQQRDLPAQRDMLANVLAEWNDDEMAEDRDFYTNRHRWRKERASFRRREEEEDQKDRELHPDAAPVATAPKATAMAIKPMAPTKIKVGVSLPSKRMNELAGDDDDDEFGGKKRRALIPLDYSGVEEDVEMLDEGERQERIKALIAKIPSTDNELWAWPIKWDVLSDDLLQEKIVPLIDKKLTELLGMADDDLASFILKSVKSAMPPQELVQELEMTLDEDAQTFVKRLWRSLIFETERVKKHL
ncbi:hypothetical protein DM01DRAFT_1390356 [Hesseltinella vesiculosa]|uniref:PWI domain-containing protein n=1 Tax=Hesseltinella vesiculosa TaxID=101127 RepID=A0A1X2GHM0_9FUNG|nr:hypothetical protein DM01DRAFT_1390356 [Hesseltinella vesiculosa]